MSEKRWKRRDGQWRMNAVTLEKSWAGQGHVPSRKIIFMHSMSLTPSVFFPPPSPVHSFFYSIYSASVTSWHDESSTALMNECSSSHKLTPLRAAAVDARHIFKSKSSTIGDRIATFWARWFKIEFVQVGISNMEHTVLFQSFIFIPIYSGAAVYHYSCI